MNAKNKIVLENCINVLNKNVDHGYTVPSQQLYPHQWLWDSCFTAIGLRHFDVKQARKELILLKRGQWSNGMLPNMIFHDNFLNFDHVLWESKRCDDAPRTVNTSCITQPPMLAEAVVKVGERIDPEDRRAWYELMFDSIINYHLWLYTERDPDHDGLTIQLHPYESGLDNSPPWMYLIGKIRYPWWIRSIHSHSWEVLINHFRRDTEYIPASQRIGLKDALECFYLIRNLSKQNYKFNPEITNNQPVMQDLTFNCILIRANKHLKSIAQEINKPLPPTLETYMEKTKESLENLWDYKHQQYYSRDYFKGKLIKQNTLATFMPLYAGCITKARAVTLVRKLQDNHAFNSSYPVPSVPLNSKRFKEDKYWQGPTWLNSNWLIIQGLREYGFNEQADSLTKISIEMVEKSGSYEYFSPLDGSPKGARDFSWTAALTIDLIKS